MDLRLPEALALGSLDGITYFLPISSDGHLALLGLLFGVGHASLGFQVLLRAAAFVAACVVLKEPLSRVVEDLAEAFARPSSLLTTRGGRDALAIVIASVPTAIVGSVLREPAGAWHASPFVIGLGLLGTSAWLLSTSFVRVGVREYLGGMGALLLGVLQGVAVLPGLSRGAVTIAGALWFGLRPRRAFELSLLISLPATLGVIVIDGRHVAVSAFSLPAVAGAACALATGLAALVVLRRILLLEKLVWFAAWTLPLAVATLALAGVWPH